MFLTFTSHSETLIPQIPYRAHVQAEPRHSPPTMTSSAFPLFTGWISLSSGVLVLRPPEPSDSMTARSEHSNTTEA